MKILLVYPRFSIPTGDPPLGLAYIAANLINHSIGVKIFDATFTPSFDELKIAIQSFDPDIVGIYVDTSMYSNTIAVASMAKDLGKFVVMGGPHATVMPESLIKHSDIVVIGEGEHTMVSIAMNYPARSFDDIPGIMYKHQGVARKTSVVNKYVELDTLPFPALQLLDMESYINRWHYLDCLDIDYKGTNLIGTRGCPFNCSFCQPALKMLFGKQIRYRSSNHIITEIKQLQKQFGINAFFFHDDTLTADRARLLEFCDELTRSQLDITWACNTRVDTIDREIMRTMYNAGLRKLHIGAESGCQRILDHIYQKSITTDQIRKTVTDAREIGIKCLCFFILGAPGETWKELYATIRFACSLPIDEASFSILTPLPGTRIREEMLKERKFVLDGNFSAYNYYSKRAFKDPQLSNITLKAWQMVALLCFYFTGNRLRYIFKHFKSFHGIKKLFRKVKRSL